MKNPTTQVHETSHVVTGDFLYAAPQDFCAIFDEDMNSLYALSLLLTGSHERAEQGFLAALDECLSGTVVFREWAHSWSRRAIVKQAIRLVAPANADGASPAALDGIANEMDASARPLLRLSQFDRFVFVICVLEGYRVRECAALLNCQPREIEQARVCALRWIAGGRELAPAAYAQNAFHSSDSTKSLHTPLAT
jgi:hypothetical protein